MERHFAKVNKETKEIEGVFVFPEDYSSFPENELWVESFPYEENPPRKHHPGIGYTYYEEYDAFVPPNIFGIGDSRVLDLESFTWVPSVPFPDNANRDDYFYLDEYKQWVTLEGPENNSGLDNQELLEKVIDITSDSWYWTADGPVLWNSEKKYVGITSNIPMPVDLDLNE